MWVPLNHSRMVAIITLQYLKIYDLCSPNYDVKKEFVLPVGQIIDATFSMFSSVNNVFEKVILFFESDFY